MLVRSETKEYFSEKWQIFVYINSRQNNQLLMKSSSVSKQNRPKESSALENFRHVKNTRSKIPKLLGTGSNVGGLLGKLLGKK